MCSIFGFYGYFDKDLLNKSTKIMNHRGPDGHGTWHHPSLPIGLAHTRLSIIDLSASGHQPMESHNKQVVITFNGEIYNFQELKKKLINKGYSFKSASDTEVLLAMYHCFGTDMLAYLNGIFSFAIWDIKEKHLFVARDQFGVKPLYYAETAKGFIFSSELKTLLLEPSVSRDINPQALHYYLSFLWSPAPDTLLTSVKKCKPGHAMIIKDTTIHKEWCYFDIPYTGQYITDSEEELIQTTYRLLKNAVKRQLISDVPVGAFLSGGVDSSTIVALANQYSTSPINCFTINLQGQNQQEGFEDDYPYAKEVASYLKVPLHSININSETLYKYLDKMIHHLDEPQADPAPINAYLICELAKQHGYKVLLSGTGGDDIFSGYRRHQALKIDSYLQFLPKFIKNTGPHFSKKIVPTSPFKRRLKKYLQYIHLTPKEKIASYFLWQNEDILFNIYTDHIKFHIPATCSLNRLIDSMNNIPNEQSWLNQMLYIDSKHFLTDHNLNYTDKMGMAHGIEIRVPFLDVDLVNFCSKTPPALKQKNNINKYILKKIASSLLPNHIVYRSKTGFGAPLRLWMKTKPFQEIQNELLSKHSLLNRGLFHPEKVNTLLQHSSLQSSDTTYFIFSLMCIELWCRKFLDTPIKVS